MVHGKLCHHPSGVRQSFPDDRLLFEWGIESYLGVPLCDPEGKVLGHLAVFDERPMPEEPRKLLMFRIFAARAAAELARLHLERELRDSEERLRDLYEEAPIAYVKEDLQSRFISANRAALRILGIKPEEVPGMVGMSLVPDTPDAQRRVQEAFASHRPRHGHQRRRPGASPQGQRQTGLGAVVVEAGTRRQIHANRCSWTSPTAS